LTFSRGRNGQRRDAKFCVSTSASGYIGFREKHHTISLTLYLIAKATEAAIGTQNFSAILCAPAAASAVASAVVGCSNRNNQKLNRAPNCNWRGSDADV